LLHLVGINSFELSFYAFISRLEGIQFLHRQETLVRLFCALHQFLQGNVAVVP